MTLYEELQKASSEEDVKDIYIKALRAGEDVPPFLCVILDRLSLCICFFA